MSTSTVNLELGSISAAAESLRAEFAKAKFAGVKTTSTRGEVHVEMPVARLTEYQFASDREHCSWTTSNRKIVVNLNDFEVRQQAKDKVFRLTFKVSRGSGIRDVFYRRSVRAIQELRTLDEGTLAEAVQAPDDYSVLLTALNTEEALAGMRSQDPLAAARLRGFAAKRQILESEGGTLSGAAAAKLLQVSRQAVDKRRSQGKLIAVELGKKGYRYPTWQFGLKGLEKVMGALSGKEPWEQISFFLNPNGALDDRTPLECLRKGSASVDEVVKAAAEYGEHGA